MNRSRTLSIAAAALIAGLPAGAGLTPAVAAPVAPTATAPAASGVTASRVTARVETPALYDDTAGGDADADDPAIWVHPRRARASLVIGTAKNAGLRVYDLAGRQLQTIAAPAAPGPGDEAGRFNNVDIVRGFALGGRRVDLAVVTDRGRDRLRFYRIDPGAASAGRAPLVDVTARNAPLLFSADQTEVNEQATGYGLAAYAANDRGYAVVSRRNTTRLGLFELKESGGRVTYKREDGLDLPSSFTLPDGSDWTPCGEPGEGPQVEGMVVDVEAEALYAAQEDVGLWRIELDLDDEEFDDDPGDRRLLEKVAEYGVPGTYDPETEECVPGADPGHGGPIRADVEGLTIYETGKATGRLIVSSQGDSTFYAYDRRTNARLGRFAIGDGVVDGVQHSDGAAAVNAALPGFPRGLLVVQDGENTPDVPGDDGEPRANTDFKYVDWRLLGLS